MNAAATGGDVRDGDRGASAGGTTPHARSWAVIIYYREPSYELRAGEREKPFQGRFHVAARDCSAAIERAMVEFRRREDESSVGWTRDVVGVLCRERP